MVTNNTYEYGIKYRVIKTRPDQFLLLPVSLEGGLSDGFDFSNGKEAIPIANEPKDLHRKYVMDNVYTTADLEEMYEYGDDTDFLADYFYDDYKDTVYVVNVVDGKLNKYAIDLSNFNAREYDMTFHLDRGLPAVTLNQECLDELLGCDDPNEVRVLLNKYKNFITSFEGFHKDNNVTSISIQDGKIVEFDSANLILSSPQVSKKTEDVPPLQDVSFTGLAKYLKERIFGHDAAIDTFAQKLYMNCTAQEGEDVESILIVGPTGTGKTETVRLAAEYLGLPYAEINTANMVPQGIVGPSLEGLLSELLTLAGGNLKLAERGIAFFDEYEKISELDLDIKKPIKPIMLTFNGGGKITVRDGTRAFTFDSKMTNKIYGGVFERILDTQKTVGFGNKPTEKPKLGSEAEIRKAIVDKKYFTVEELSRINNVLGFDELSLDTKRNILLHSKSSAFAKKRDRYKRQFGIDLIAREDYIDAIIDYISNSDEGMRTVNNFVSGSINPAEQAILSSGNNKYKRLVLTRDTVADPNHFDLT